MGSFCRAGEYFGVAPGEFVGYFRSHSYDGLTILEGKMQWSGANLDDLLYLAMS